MLIFVIRIIFTLFFGDLIFTANLESHYPNLVLKKHEEKIYKALKNKKNLSSYLREKLSLMNSFLLKII